MVTEQISNKLRVKLIKSVLSEGFPLPDAEQALRYVTFSKNKSGGRKGLF